MLGDVIRANREQRGWSQSELARRSGLTQGHINQIEAGKRLNPSVEVLQRVAQAFGVGVDSLLQDSPLAPLAQDIAQAPANELTKLWSRLSAEDKETVMRVARRLAQGFDS